MQTLCSSKLALIALALNLFAALPLLAGQPPTPPAGWSSGYVIANGIRIHFWRTGGDKPVLVLAHGTRYEHCMEANYQSFVGIIDRFVDIGKERLIPPEVWAVGSEVEVHGDMGFESMKAYSRSKKAFARRAKEYFSSNELMYKHIVPSAFTSPMGTGLMSASFAVSYALFFIRRGFNYIPVTYTGLAHLNYFWFRFFIRSEVSRSPRESLASSE